MRADAPPRATLAALPQQQRFTAALWQLRWNQLLRGPSEARRPC
ncbi:hypothetical protein PR002_g29551 [Phytophthora rubi]|uniref:Uncharacterized protein n=1 Tax=Phytophthora rubi TaxID=129364 RepID=A0A6A3GZY0_9STRA|nr:hypothetical protein PR002_g29551 [Phytophthora rubi]